MNTQQWISELFATIDKKDSSGFKTFLAEDCVFRFGNMPPVTGSEAIAEAVHQFFQSLKSITHEIDGVIEEGNRIVCHGWVTYTKLDDSILKVPFADIFSHDNDKIAEYFIFIDISGLSDA